MTDNSNAVNPVSRTDLDNIQNENVLPNGLTYSRIWVAIRN